MTTKKTKQCECISIKDDIQAGMDMMTNVQGFGRRKKGTGKRLLELTTAEYTEPTRADVTGRKSRGKLIPRYVAPPIDARTFGPHSLVKLHREEFVLDPTQLTATVPHMTDEYKRCSKCLNVKVPISSDFCERCGYPVSKSGIEIKRRQLEKKGITEADEQKLIKEKKLRDIQRRINEVAQYDKLTGDFRERRKLEYELERLLKQR